MMIKYSESSSDFHRNDFMGDNFPPQTDFDEGSDSGSNKLPSKKRSAGNDFCLSPRVSRDDGFQNRNKRCAKQAEKYHIDESQPSADVEAIIARNNEEWPIMKIIQEKN